MTRREVEPWERRHDLRETPRAYAAFCVYRDMGVMDRSYRKTAAAINRNLSRIKEWSKKYHWQARIEAFDEHLEREARAAQAAAIREMNERHGRMAAEMIQKITARLLGDDVKKIPALDPGNLTTQDLARLAEVAVKIERVALGAEQAEKKADEQPPEIRIKLAFEPQPDYPDADVIDGDAIELPQSELGQG